MSDETEQLVDDVENAVREIGNGSGSTSPYCAARAALRAHFRAKDERLAKLESMRPQWRGLEPYFHCCCQIDPDDGCKVLRECAFHADQSKRLAELEAEVERWKEDARNYRSGDRGDAAMSDETERLVNALVGAATEAGASPEDDRESIHYARAALLAYIERIERERDGYYNEAADGWGKFREAERRIAELECERDEARTILAHTDIGSLPNDWTLKQVAEARINDLMKLRDQVRDTCARAEKAEAENARLRPLAPVLNGFVGPPPTPEQWERICAKAASVRRLLVELDARARP